MTELLSAGSVRFVSPLSPSIYLFIYLFLSLALCLFPSHTLSAFLVSVSYLSCHCFCLSVCLSACLSLSPRAHVHVVEMLRFMSFDINQPSLPTPLYSTLGVSFCLYSPLNRISFQISPDKSPLPQSVLPALLVLSTTYLVLKVSRNFLLRNRLFLYGSYFAAS